MALSNWDTFAIEFEIFETTDRDQSSPEAARLRRQLDEKAVAAHQAGEEAFEALVTDPEWSALVSSEIEAYTTRTINQNPSEGRFTCTEQDWYVELYKNWLYIGSQSRHSARDNSADEFNTQGHIREGFSFPTLIEVQQGDVRLGALQINAVRGPQEGVFVVATTSERNPNSKSRLIRGMVGCGVYGYDERGEFVGVSDQSRQFLRNFLNENELVPRALTHLDLSEGERFNQGDAFFAGEFGIETPSSEVGAPESPIINDAVRGLENGAYDSQLGLDTDNED